MIPDSFKQDLLNRVDIVDVVSRYVQLKKGGANYLGLCPFHNEKTPSFTVSPAKQFYHCFGCGAHGNAIGFVMAYSALGYIDAIKELASSVGLQVPESRPATPQQAARREREVDLHGVLEKAMDFYRAELKKSQRAIAYLKGRGVTGEIAARFRIGYAPDDWQALKAVFEDYSKPFLVEAGLVIENEGKRYDRFRDRVMFPIFNARGAVIGFGGRVMGEGEPKYLNSPETPVFEKGRELYGLVQAREALHATGCAIVVEGYMDVVGLAQFGVGNAVATLGTATTPVHVSKLLRLADEIVFCFDGDAAGRKAAWRALEVSLPLVQDEKSMRFLFLPESEDPDTYIRRHGKEDFERKAANADTLSQYLVAELRSQCDLSTPEGRARFAATAMPHVQKVTALHLKPQLINEIARVAEVTTDELIARHGSPGQPQYKRPARPREKRPPPSSVEWKVLSRVAAYPALAAEIKRDLMDPKLEESRALAEMSALVHTIGASEPISPALLIEKFKDSPHEHLLFEAQAHCLDLKETEDESRAYVIHTLGALEVARKREELKTYEERLGRGELTNEEHRRYASMISEVRTLEQRLQTDARQQAAK